MLYLDGAFGISGDMFVAALLDLGGNREKLAWLLDSLHLEQFHYEIEEKSSYGVAGLDFQVQFHDSRDLKEESHPGVAHAHRHQDDSHSHFHRNLADVYAVIDRGAMSDRARDIAKRTFRIIAEAESKAHGRPLQEVHFHEVGAIDSIVDIVSTAILIDDLDISDVVVTGFAEGRGYVHCQHGDLPVPVPAVLNIAQTYGIELRPCNANGEMVTPTGIALAAALRTRERLPEKFLVEGTGVGLGKRDFGRPNFFRVMLVREEDDPERIYVIESDIDDSTGEELGHVMEVLFEEGALDVHFIPCIGKKNRPSCLVRVLVTEPLLSKAEEILLRETTTIGVRHYPVQRTIMERSRIVLSLPYGAVEAKRLSFGKISRIMPEYESVKAVSERTGRPLSDVMTDARAAGLQVLRNAK